MARTKTRYREIKSNTPPVEEFPAENIPEIKLNGVEAEPVAAAPSEIQPQPEPNLEAIAKAANEAATADEAALALKRQIEALHQSEQLQRQHQAAQMAQNVPTTREGKLSLWESQGASAAELKFLEANPELIDLPQLTARAAAEASQQGHERGSEAHMEATKKLFHEHLSQLQTQAAANPATQETPAFFRPAAIRKPAAPSPANYVSAPVSREVPSGGYREPSLSQVKLSPEELEIARGLGLSDTQYARGKLRLEKEKARGERQV